MITGAVFVAFSVAAFAVLTRAAFADARKRYIAENRIQQEKQDAVLRFTADAGRYLRL
jgi:hypothetical protein